VISSSGSEYSQVANFYERDNGPSGYIKAEFLDQLSIY
jgi:hypothetical protein